MSFVNKNPYFKESISETLKNLGYKELDSDEAQEKIFYCDVSYGTRNNPSYKQCEIVNQLENINLLGNKKLQYDNHCKYYNKRPEYMPMTISFNRSGIDDIGTIFIQNPRESPKVYIVKPENDSFRNGCGIVRNKLELLAHLDAYNMYDDWIIQDYIDNPLLINERKFHFRIYVIYVQTPNYQAAYLSDVGFIYTANKPFREDSYEEDVALSGESSPENVFYVPDDFYKNFGKQVWDNEVRPQLVKITRETLKSVLDTLKCPVNTQKCFKILGYDILINNDYKCYLAEINARGVTYKYPNKEFLDNFYKNILKLVLSPEAIENSTLKKENIPYERILFKKNGELIEGFNGIKRITDNKEINDEQKFNRYYWRIICPIFIIIIILLAFHLLLRSLFHRKRS